MLPSFSPSSSRLWIRRLDFDWTKYWLIFVVLGGALAGYFFANFLYSFPAVYLMALVGAVLVAAWILCRPESLPLAVLFCFVAAACPYLQGGGAMNAIRWAALAGGTYYLAIEFFRRRLPLRLRAEHVPILLFCAWALASTTYSTVPLLTLLKAGAFCVLILFCFLFAGRVTADPAKPAEELFRALVLLNAFFIPASLLVRLTGREMHRNMAFGRDPNAMFGLFGNPNSLGVFIALTLPALLWGWHRWPRWRYALTGLVALNAFCLFATLSRASYAAGLSAVVLYLLLQRRKWVLVLGVATAMVLSLYLAYAPSAIEQASARYIYKSRTGVLVSRTHLWKESLDYIQQRWVLGYGFGVSPGVTEEWSPAASSAGARRHRGNGYLATWEETGIVGLGLVCLFAFLVALRGLRYLWTQRSRADAHYSTVLLTTATVLAGIMNTFFEGWLLAAGFFGALVFWLALFLLLRELHHAA